MHRPPATSKTRRARWPWGAAIAMFAIALMVILIVVLADALRWAP
ncbi:MAG TPA: hypothetical protein VGX25_23090 [Actinophytocola sp.]|nr:hypothetical protein [Actinophytocola sp.]HEV2782287.1 hypothetical protein [Actinophytocola sp.]